MELDSTYRALRGSLMHRPWRYFTARKVLTREERRTLLDYNLDVAGWTVLIMAAGVALGLAAAG